MMQLPELFGSPYITLGVIVVVLLLIFLLIIIVRNRKKAGAAVKESAPPSPTARRAAGPPDGEKPSITQSQPAEPTPEMVPAAAVVPTAPPDSQPTPESPPTPKHHAPPDQRPVLPSSGDPLQAVITDILQGWGDLTPEDTNRLAIFRRDRVLAALAAVELPKGSKANESARARLGQLRQYAASLEPGDQQPGPVDFAAIGQQAGQAPGATLAQEPGVAAEHTTPESQAAAVAQETGEAPEPAPGPKPEHKTPGEPPPGADLDTQIAAAAAPPTEGFPAGAGLASAEQAAETPAPAEKPIDLWGTDAADAPAMTPIPPEPVVDLWGTQATEVPKNTEEAVAAAAAAFWAKPGAPKPAEQDSAIHKESSAVQPSADAPLVPQEPPAPTGPEPPAKSPLGLGDSISTAEALLALPAGEQTDMLAFLEPAELDKVFRAGQDSELKKSVIDTLENVGSPDALEVLRRCLDDPDPEIQMHALEAADRILGTD